MFEKPGTNKQPQGKDQKPKQAPRQQPRTPNSYKRAGGGLNGYISTIVDKHKGLEHDLAEKGIKTSPIDFVKRMLFASILLAIIVAVALFVIMYKLAPFPTKQDNLLLPLLLGAVAGYAIFNGAFRSFLNYPSRRYKTVAVGVERSILYAARHLIISLRAGLPLFNAIAYVSVGYGDASKEFAKIVDRVQLGDSLEQAIEETIEQSGSKTFKRIMLQAYSSIRSGSNVEAALQSVVDQVTQERMIEQRRYGQKLNALAMFYMLFGVIMPSMGIAVATILTTFISIFSINQTVLAMGVIGIAFMQFMFLQMMRSARPISAA